MERKGDMTYSQIWYLNIELCNWIWLHSYTLSLSFSVSLSLYLSLSLSLVFQTEIPNSGLSKLQTKKQSFLIREKYLLRIKYLIKYQVKITRNKTLCLQLP